MLSATYRRSTKWPEGLSLDLLEPCWSPAISLSAAREAP